MDPATKPGLFRAWCDDVKSFNAKEPRGSLTPHLEIGAALVTVFVSSFFAAYLASAFAVLVAYGPHAYFREGLRVSDWKHSVLSNGAHLSLIGMLVEVLTTLILWVAAIFAADFCSMLIPQSIRGNGRWARVAFRLAGGAALMVFAGLFYRQGGWGLHPIPLSALDWGSGSGLEWARVCFQEIHGA